MPMIQSGNLISRTFVDVYEYLDWSTLPKPEKEIEYERDEDRGGSDYDRPKKRSERYGTWEKGLQMASIPKGSGHGTHGETGQWTFRGLPEPMKITGTHDDDMRMPSGTLSLRAEGLDKSQTEWLRLHFAQALRHAVGEEWHFENGKWWQ